MPGSRRRNENSGLTAQQQCFADEYLVDFDAAAAHIRAGYKARGRSGRNSAKALLATNAVRAYIQHRLARISDKLEVTSEHSLQELARIAFFDPRKMYEDDGTIKAVKDMDDDTRAAIASVEIIGGTTRIRLASKIDALGKLALHFGLLTKKVESGVRITSISGILEEIDGSDCSAGPASSRRELATRTADVHQSKA
jgi:phage terminase small subunit